MPQAILDAALDGDVVICMGAGSIGAVPGKLAATQFIAKTPQKQA
jgi:UDP-N-acetylmuramate--alanine ligase